MKELKYDGVIIEEDEGSFGRKTKAVIALQNNQVKSADPVTCDDAGNVIPLSERFNPEKADIRYSVRDAAIAEIEKAVSDKNYGGDIQLTDTTPAILLGHSGVRNLPLVERAAHIRENILNEDEAIAMGLKVGENIHYHGLGFQLYIKVINDLDTVSLAYRETKNAADPSRRENYFLLISQHKDGSGNVINVPVVIDQRKNVNRVFIDANVVATVFGRNGFQTYISEELRKGNLVRIKRKSITNSESPEQRSVDYDGNASTHLISQPATKSQDQISESTREEVTEEQLQKLRDTYGEDLPEELLLTADARAQRVADREADRAEFARQLAGITETQRKLDRMYTEKQVEAKQERRRRIMAKKSESEARKAYNEGGKKAEAFGKGLAQSREYFARKEERAKADKRVAEVKALSEQHFRFGAIREEESKADACNRDLNTKPAIGIYGKANGLPVVLIDIAGFYG